MPGDCYFLVYCVVLYINIFIYKNNTYVYFNLSITNLSTSDIKLAKSVFLAKPDVSTSIAFFKSSFVA